MNKKLIVHMLVLLIVVVMVGAAELLNENEIIFPEITAIAVGALIAPKMHWKTTRLRMLACIMLCAIAGVCIVLLVPGPSWFKITLAYGIAEVIFLCSGTSFAPMISAIALPVLLGTESPVYIIAAFLLTAFILCLHIMLEMTGIKEPAAKFKPVKVDKQDWRDAVMRLIFVGIAAWLVLRSGNRYIIAPPLLVAFTEFSRRDSSARKIPVKAVSTIALCALAGSLCRYYIHLTWGLPLTLAAAAAALLMIFIMEHMKVYIPPAGALCILPMLLPAKMVVGYPVQIFIGATLFMILSLLMFRSKSHISVN